MNINEAVEVLRYSIPEWARYRYRNYLRDVLFFTYEERGVKFFEVRLLLTFGEDEEYYSIVAWVSHGALEAIHTPQQFDGLLQRVRKMLHPWWMTQALGQAPYGKS